MYILPHLFTIGKPDFSESKDVLTQYGIQIDGFLRDSIEGATDLHASGREGDLIPFINSLGLTSYANTLHENNEETLRHVRRNLELADSGPCSRFTSIWDITKYGTSYRGYHLLLRLDSIGGQKTEYTFIVLRPIEFENFKKEREYYIAQEVQDRNA